MPVNKNHTERIAALEQYKEDTLNLPRRMKEMEDEQSNHDVSIEDLHTRLQDLAQREISLENTVQSIYNEMHPLVTPSKKNTKNISIAQLVKALLFIPFTTLKG